MDVPYPVDYGGVYDLFYKLPALHNEGIKIHLHCFENGRPQQPELNKYCDEVLYYKRNTGHKGFSNKLPYIVASRKNETLLENLLKDDYPILMEGVHSTYPLLDKRFSFRKKFVRLHNVEQLYYRQLYRSEKNIFKKMYFLHESRLLAGYENMIAKNASACWSVSHADVEFYINQLHCITVKYLPLFVPQWQVHCMQGMGTYCLYHGNLSVAENEFAVIWLLKNVFNTLEIPFVIAGKNPSKRLEALMHKRSYTCLVANPGEEEMDDMLAKAHINILPSFNNTGIKIKLLNALYNGRHCLVNDAMVAGTGLEELCHIAHDANTMKQLILQLYHQPFTKEEVETRKNILHVGYNNKTSAKQMVKWIWETYL